MVNENSSVVSGTVGLVVEIDDGIWIVDHKSDQIEDPEAALSNYLPQLECYAKSMSSMGCKVLGVAINWIRRGEIVLVRL